MRVLRPEDNCVLQPWLFNLNLKQQTVVLLSLRGPDQGTSKELKPLIRWLRSLVLKNADPAKDFMKDTTFTSIKEMEKNNPGTIDMLSIHYIQHLIVAIEVIAFKHPHLPTRGLAYKVYTELCHHFNMMPEGEEDFDNRLIDFDKTKRLRI
jgi:hypothetical protein